MPVLRRAKAPRATSQSQSQQEGAQIPQAGRVIYQTFGRRRRRLCCINWEHRYLLAMAHDLLRYNSKHQSAQKSLPLFLTIGLKVFSPSLHVTPNAKLRAGH